MFWTNGGPGGSSAIGLFTELGAPDIPHLRCGSSILTRVRACDILLGPCRVTSANSTERNPWSWNEYANIFFVDQPVDVGYSYAEYGEAVVRPQSWA